MDDFQVRDVSLNRYHFFLGEFGGDSQKEINKKKKSFADVLEKTVNAVGGWTMTHQARKPEIYFRDGISSPIATSEVKIGERTSQWLADGEGKYSRKIVARSLLDVCYLQTAVMKNGLLKTGELEKTLSEFPKFDDTKTEDDEGEYEFETRGHCVYLEMPEGSAAANFPFEKTIAAFGDLKIKNLAFQELDFNYARIGIYEDVGEAAWVVAAADKKLAAELVDNVLPELFLSIAKVNNEYLSAKKDLAQAKSVGEAIEEYLTESLPVKTPSLGKMETHSEKLSELRTGLAAEINEAYRHLKTIKINIGNAEKLIDAPLLDEQKIRLNELLIKSLRLKQEQIEADIGYLETILIKGNSVNEKYKDITQIRLGYYSRALAILFGLISALGILQLMKEFGELPLQTRIISLGVVFIIFILAAFWSKIWKVVNRK